MGKPYSDDLRERVVAAIEAGHTREEVAKRYNMALSTVGGFIKRKRETGSVSPDKFGGYKTFTLEPHTDRVKELVAEQPDSTLAELQVRLAKEKVKVSQSGISRFLHHINLTFKKSVRAAEQDRPDVAAARKALRAAATSGRSCSAARTLFLKVRLMWWRNREIPDWLTLTFSFAKRT